VSRPLALLAFFPFNTRPPFAVFFWIFTGILFSQAQRCFSVRPFPDFWRDLFSLPPRTQASCCSLRWTRPLFLFTFIPFPRRFPQHAFPIIPAVQTFSSSRFLLQIRPSALLFLPGDLSLPSPIPVVCGLIAPGFPFFSDTYLFFFKKWELVFLSTSFGIEKCLYDAAASFYDDVTSPPLNMFP